MILGLHHIGIGVKNLEESIQAYQDILGIEVESIHDAKDRGRKIAMLSVGNAKLELVERVETGGDESHIGRISHVALQVDDIDKELDALVAKGVRLRDPEPRQGVSAKRVAWLHPEVMNGVMVELVEKES
ncbi:VOC family protein [Chloroflexota bacterium]